MNVNRTWLHSMRSQASCTEQLCSNTNNTACLWFVQLTRRNQLTHARILESYRLMIPHNNKHLRRMRLQSTALRSATCQ